MAPFSALPRRIRKGHDTHVEFQALLGFKLFAPGQFDFVRNNIEIGRCRTKNHHAGASPLTKLFECVLDLDQIPSGTERPYPANGISKEILHTRSKGDQTAWHAAGWQPGSDTSGKL